MLQAISELDTPELDKIAHEVARLRARRHARSLDATESDLLEAISATVLPPEKRQRLYELGRRMEKGELSAAERSELIELSEQSELLHSERMQFVSQLAGLQGVPFTQLLVDLEIRQVGGAEICSNTASTNLAT